MYRKIILQYLNLIFSLMFFLSSSSILFSNDEDYDILDESIYNRKILKLDSFIRKISRTSQDIVLHLGYDSPYMCSVSLLSSVRSLVQNHSDKAFHIVKIPDEIIKRDSNADLVISVDGTEPFLSSYLIQTVSNAKKGKIVGLISDTSLYELDPESLTQLQKYFDYLVPYSSKLSDRNKDAGDKNIESDEDIISDLLIRNTRGQLNYLGFFESILGIMDAALTNPKAKSYLYLKEGSPESLELTLDILSNSLYSNVYHYPLNLYLQMNYNPSQYSSEKFVLAASLLASQLNQLKSIYSSVAKFYMTLTTETNMTYISLPTHLKTPPTIEERDITEDSKYYKQRMKLLREGRAHYASMNTINTDFFGMTLIRNDEDKTLFVQLFYTAIDEIAFYDSFVDLPQAPFPSDPNMTEDDILFNIHVNNKTFPIRYTERYNIVGKHLIGFNNVLDLKNLEFKETEELVVMFSLSTIEDLSTLLSSQEPSQEEDQLPPPQVLKRKIFFKIPLINISTDMIYSVKAVESFYIYHSLFKILDNRMRYLDSERAIGGKYKFGSKFYSTKEELKEQIDIALQLFGKDLEDQYRKLNEIDKKHMTATHHVSASLEKALNTVHNCYDFFNDDID